MSESLYVIRKSFPFLVARIILSELLLECIYVGYRVVVYFVNLQDLSMVNLLNNLGTLVFVAVSVIQVTLLIYLVLSWLGETYELNVDQIEHKKGVFGKTSQSFLYTNIQQITTRQSFIERIFNTGSVNLFIPALGHDVIFTEVPSPDAFAELVRKKMPQGAGTSRILLQRR